MLTKKTITSIVLLGIFFGGCAPRDIKLLRKVEQAKEHEISTDRALNIRYNDTAYSRALEIYGQHLHQFLLENKGLKQKTIDRLRIGIDNIYDKTGKVYGKEDAISDMVLEAFNKISIFPMVNLSKPSTYSNLNIRENLLAKNYKGNKNYIKTPNLISTLPLGVLKPTTFYISGALLQYDKTKQNKTSLDIKYLSVGRNFEIIDVSLDLRIINSSLGVVSHEEGEKSASISLKNRVVSLSMDGEYFKLIRDDAYGINISHEIGDPTQYAVREIVELAVLEVVSRWLGLPWKKTDAIESVHKFHSQFVVKGKK